MINYSAEKDCCGCAACAHVCPKQCIEMRDGSLGHLFAVSDQSKCVDCGLCDNVCPMKKPSAKVTYPQTAYAAYSLDREIRFRGSSGGMFETFARQLLEKGYHVYGAAFDNNLKLKCSCAVNVTELPPLTKSKYLQSDFREKYAEIRSKLICGEKVFVVSTPCQITALKRILGKEYENLFTMDFFCHGVPSQRFFDECISYEEKTQYKGTVTDYTFRAKKKNGATPHYYSVEISIGSAVKKKNRALF